MPVPCPLDPLSQADDAVTSIRNLVYLLQFPFFLTHTREKKHAHTLSSPSLFFFILSRRYSNMQSDECRIVPTLQPSLPANLHTLISTFIHDTYIYDQKKNPSPTSIPVPTGSLPLLLCSMHRSFAFFPPPTHTRIHIYTNSSQKNNNNQIPLFHFLATTVPYVTR